MNVPFAASTPTPATRPAALTAGRTAACRGFTLIELVVVMLIVGILATTVLAHHASVVDERRHTVLQEALRQVEVDAHALADLDGTVDPRPFLTDAAAGIQLGQVELDRGTAQIRVDDQAGTVTYRRDGACARLTVPADGGDGTITTC